MTFVAQLKPKFWDHVDPGIALHKPLFFFRRVWKLATLLTLVLTLVPLMIMAAVVYRVNQNAMLTETMQRTLRLTANTRRHFITFLTERKAILNFLHRNTPYDALIADGHLEQTLVRLQKSFGEFVDLGVIDHRGIQLAYAGPLDRVGKDYHNADWFQHINAGEMYTSDLFSGFRNVPHMVIAVKYLLPAGGFYIFKATLDATRFNDLSSRLAMGDGGDAFVINHAGILQTNSPKYGAVLSRINLTVPDYSEHSIVEIISRSDKTQMVRGYAYIPQTPFIIMIIQKKPALLAVWKRSRKEMIAVLALCSAAILILVVGGTTFLVNQIYLVDQRRLATMHQAEYTNKMSSIARLSAGVAHEINNPLAIINEKAGLIKDLFTYRPEYTEDPKLMGLIDSVLASVARCASITRRLLNFVSRSQPLIFQYVEISTIFAEVMVFWGKEAEHRSIKIDMEIDPGIPMFQSDPGCLQEIIFNLFTNAFAAMDDGGRLHLSASVLERKTDPQNILIKVSDTGHGIPNDDLEKVFEPFYSTKMGKSGTGLGLSITYGLVQKLGGRIIVRSEVDKGATFEITLPINPPQDKFATNVTDAQPEVVA